MSTSQHESLRDIALLAQERHDGAGGRAMQRLAEGAGKVISSTTFDRIVGGIYRSQPQAKTLDALAYLAGVPEERVYKAAGRPYVAEKFAKQLPPDVDTLTKDQREALISVARAFLKTNKELEGLKDELQQLKESDPPNLRAVPEDDHAEDSGAEQKIAAYDRELGDNIQPGQLPED
jgi:transcriptional regulator with XRE-family HTH domain